MIFNAYRAPGIVTHHNVRVTWVSVPTTQSTWDPRNDVERQLFDAVGAGDLAAMIGILAAARLFLPGFADPGPEGGQRVLTRDRDSVPYLLAFTSPELMSRVVGVDDWRQTSLSDLVRDWPDPTWGLAVNPATPIGVLVAPRQLATLVRSPASMAQFEPANEVERLLRDALLAPDGEVLLDVLVTAQVDVPTQSLELDDVPTVAVFTSPERCAEFLAGAGIEVPTVRLDLVAVLKQWPGPEYRLSVNPGSPINFSLPAERIGDLLRHASGLVVRRFGAEIGPGPVEEGPAIGVDITDLLRGLN
jgi:hypothetical protein